MTARPPSAVGSPSAGAGVAVDGRAVGTRRPARRAGSTLPDDAGSGLPGDAGSTLPFVLLCFLIAAFLVFGVTAASSAFLAQRDLQADCDSAAVAAAGGVDLREVYDGRLDRADALPLAVENAQAALRDHQSDGGAPLSVTVSVDIDRVTLECRRVVQIPFGRLFGVGGGLERTAVSAARSPLRP